jgi:hypothetical protein
MSATDLGLYLDACIGDTTARLHIATGRNPRLSDGRYVHEEWTQSHFEWAAEADQAVREIAHTATEPDTDVYVCPYLMWGNKHTAPGEIAARVQRVNISRT